MQCVNYQSPKSKIPVGEQTPELEVTYLRPLIKGINISRFHVEPSEYIVAFPYDIQHNQAPLSVGELLDKAPNLLKYYATNKDYLTMQTAYSDKIIGKKNAEYYALARTGRYCHADWYVIFRDNTKWVAAVTGKINTDWGGTKIPAFQIIAYQYVKGRMEISSQKMRHITFVQYLILTSSRITFYQQVINAHLKFESR